MKYTFQLEIDREIVEDLMCEIVTQKTVSNNPKVRMSDVFLFALCKKLTDGEAGFHFDANEEYKAKRIDEGELAQRMGIAAITLLGALNNLAADAA